MTTHVPFPTFGVTGLTVPAELDILAGVQADQQAAFGGNLNPSLTTPQGQLAQSLTAIIGNKNNQFLALANSVDPAFASGRMQDAIGRIYYLTRIPASSTTVTATCMGNVGAIIPVGAKATDQAGTIYQCTQAGTIPSSGSINLTFACVTTGAIACPIGYLNKIYQSIAGWDSITNAVAGVVGNAVESRADFEFRRSQSVALNAQGSLQSILGSVLQIPDVLDAYAIENVTEVTSGAAVTGSISGLVLTVTNVSSGTISVGHTIVGAGVEQGTTIVSLGTGTTGTGTYNINISQSISSESLTIAYGGVRLVNHSLYIAVYGGVAQAIAQAIWNKKSPGCNYNGNTTETVYDYGNALNPYHAPYPSYAVTFEIPTPVPIKFAVHMQNSAQVPSDAMTQVKNAIYAAFHGSEGSQRARIGSDIFHSNYYACLFNLGKWVLIYDIRVGVTTVNRDSVLIQINQVPTLTLADITVTFI